MYFLTAIMCGVVIGILLGFTEFDVVGHADAIGVVTKVIAFLGLAAGAVLGYRESLPGTKISNKTVEANRLNAVGFD